MTKSDGGEENYRWWYHGECVFFNEKGLCILHDEGLKPFGGRIATHDGYYENRNETLKLWNQDKGRSIIKKFKVLSE